MCKNVFWYPIITSILLGRTGRVGNPGKAISFVDETYDAELLDKLIPLCQDAGVPIDDWMEEIRQSGGGGGDSDGGAAGGDDEDEDWG